MSRRLRLALLLQLMLPAWAETLELTGSQTDSRLESPPEVRQLVTFAFQPGKTGEAIEAFRELALPLYERNPAMLRFRGYREAESPEPLDLVVVSTFRGMEGMDASNRRLRQVAAERGDSIAALYGRIGALSLHHHDQFVEMMDGLRLARPEGEQATGGSLVVLEYLDAVSDGAEELEELMASQLHDWEKTVTVLNGSETARFLIGDGWEFLRFLRFENLGALHHYLSQRRSEGWWRSWERLVDRTKTIVLVELEELSVR